MDVKRGHRRRLQREISTAKGFPQSAPLYIRHGFEDSDNQIHSTIHFQPSNNVPQQVPYFSGPQSTNSATLESRNGSSRGDDTPDQQDHPENGGSKRKYKRHPKRDKNAPIKPLSAYVMFAHKIREEYAGQNISFPDMAKIVGERWKNVSPQVKEAIENEAAKNKEEYQAAMAVYKTTESWKKYQEYLKEFKEKYESNSRDSNKRNKRQKTTSPDSDNTPPSGYSSTRSTSVGYDNSSGNVSSESSNGNGNGHGHGHNVQHLSYSNYSLNSNNCLPPYPHTNPTVSYARYTNNNRGNSSSTFLTPPSSTNNGNNSTSSTILEDLYAKDDSNVGDDQSQLGNSSSSGNGNSSSGSGRSAERPNVEDSDNSITSSSNSTPPACFMEADDNQDRQSRQQSSQNQIDQIKMLDHNHTDKITRNN